MNRDQLEDLLGIRPGRENGADYINKEWSEEFNEDAGYLEEQSKLHEPKETVFNLDQWEIEQGEMLSDTIGQSNDHNLQMADFFAASFRQSPEIENTCTNTRFHQFMETLLESPDFNVLHQSTRSNVLTSNMASVQFAKEYAKMESRDENIQHKVVDGEMDSEMADRLNEINLFRAIGKALQNAQEEVDQLQNMMRAFGASEGNGGNTDLERVKELFNKVKHDAKIRRIIELAGRYRLSAQSKQRQKVKHGYDDMVGVKLDGDIGKLLPLEMAKLADPEFELDAMRRIVERQSMCREYQGIEHLEKGPVIICVDESSSMRGEPIANAKAFALAMYWIARHQGRQCMFFSFHSGSQYIACGMKKGRKYPAELVDWLGHFFGGGTDLQVPLVEVPDMWLYTTDIDHGKTDMIIITDACLSVSDSMKSSFLKWKAKEQVKVQTIVIGANGDSVKEVSDVVHCIKTISVNEEAVSQAFSI